MVQDSRGIRLSTSPYRGIERPCSNSETKFKVIIKTCSKHGLTEFRSFKTYKKNPIGYRCDQCYRDKKNRNRKKNCRDISREKKKNLVETMGGSCKLCGYNKCLQAIHFHHLDKTTKHYEIAWGLRKFSLEKLKIEASKCVLLCNRCHTELEEGLVVL